ncbi:hypothetical protein HT136_18910 [Novosphingobium profundi]|uniref:hypothetical protein n=1 Tax=Novosphingobium profundi TaxID=1774954 RepID=UPI001BD9FA88|nr:hypothetical protein [Novosphingobium profundi]MBT0670443.1 hypothetical protein [Novosphingobium profundi]
MPSTKAPAPTMTRAPASQHASTHTYQDRLRDFIADCARSTVSEEPARIREAACLLGRADAEAGTGPCLETLLAVGAGLSGVISLIGEILPVMCSRGPGGICLAMVAVDDGKDEICAEGATLALALLGAWAGACLAESEEEADAFQGHGAITSVH